MATTVTLNVLTGSNSNETREYTVMTTDKVYINSVITVGENNTITESQMKQLQDAAKRGGDMGVLEKCDLNADEKLKLSSLNGFEKYYDIKLSSDGKLFQVTVKDAGLLITNPTLGSIKKDFGVRDNVFIQKGNIPYGNESLIYKRGPGIGANDKYHDYDKTKLEVGDTINIPVEEVNIDGSPRGFLGRLFQ